MKRYMLKIDIPFARAGDMVEMWSDGTMAFVGDPTLPRFNKKDVRMFTTWFEEIKELELPEEFFCIDIDKAICYSYSFFQHSENTRQEYIRFTEKYKSVGNYFKTKEEAEKYLEYLKAKEVIKQDTKDFKPNFNNTEQPKYFGRYGGLIEKPTLDWNITRSYTYSTIFFRTLEDIKESFKKHPEEWKIYLAYEQ